MFGQAQTRFILIAVAGVSLLVGLWTGTVRLGWTVPVLDANHPSLHGPLMVAGFLGILIGLERAVALGRLWPYGVPLCVGIGILSLLAGLPGAVGVVLIAAGSLGLVAIFFSLFRQSPSAPFFTMALSGVAWVVGNCLWLVGNPLHIVTPWWTGFLVLMIAGERLELSRIIQPPRSVRALFHLSTALVMIGLGVSLLEFNRGVRLTGVGLVAQAIWLLRYDIAWRTVREPGLPRFMAASLLGGYFWLALGGLLWIAFAEFFSAGPRYDAMLHTIFVGFVLSMIFAHAPVIFPVITGVALPFQPLFYVHLTLLYLGLLLRVIGDITLWLAALHWGGLLNVVAVLVFLINNMRAATRKTVRLTKSS